MRFLRPLGTILLGCATTNGIAAPPPDDATDSARQKAIEALLSSIGEKEPGVALAVVVPGKRPMLLCRGLAEIETGTAINSETRFYAASVAKQFTAACVLIAERDKKLSRSDRVSKYIPTFGGTPATIADLLDHRGGVPDLYTVIQVAGAEGDPLQSNVAALEVLARLAPTCEAPGLRFSYSNSGFLALTEVIHRATGTSFAAYAHDKLFVPLGMKRSVFRDRRDLEIDSRAFAYHYDGGRHLREDEDEEVGLCGPGGLFTTLTDLVAWGEYLHGGGSLGADLLAAQSAARPQPKGFRSDPKFISYAAGIMVGDLRGHPVIRHSGGTGSFSADVIHCKDPDFSVFCLANGSEVAAPAIAQQVAEIWLGEPETTADEPAAAPDSPLPPNAMGLYANTSRDEVWLLARDDQGYLVSTVGLRIPLRATGERRFEGRRTSAPLTIEFRDGTNGSPMLHIVVGEAPLDLDFVTSAPSPVKDADDLVGAYRHTGLGTLLDVSIAAGKLVLAPRSGDSNPMMLSALDADTYFHGAMIAHFERGADGKPTGFAVQTERARNQQFVREP